MNLAIAKPMWTSTHWKTSPRLQVALILALVAPFLAPAMWGFGHPLAWSPMHAWPFDFYRATGPGSLWFAFYLFGLLCCLWRIVSVLPRVWLSLPFLAVVSYVTLMALANSFYYYSATRCTSLAIGALLIFLIIHALLPHHRTELPWPRSTRLGLFVVGLLVFLFAAFLNYGVYWTHAAQWEAAPPASTPAWLAGQSKFYDFFYIASILGLPGALLLLGALGLLYSTLASIQRTWLVVLVIALFSLATIYLLAAGLHCVGIVEDVLE